MKVTVVSIGSFDTQYSDYHIMRDIILGMLKRGFQVTLIQKQYFDVPRYPAPFTKYLGTQLIVKNIRFDRKAKADLRARYLADLFYYHKACKLMKKDLPDKIFLQSNNTAFITVWYAKHILKRPIHYNEQDIFPENALFAGILNSNSLIYKVAHALQKYAYKNANALSTISDDMKKTIVNRFGIDKDKIKVIYNWGHEELRANPLSENVFLKRFPKKDEEIRVVYAGNLGKMQNVELILQTAARMKEYEDISFYIVGSGVNEENLKKYAREHELGNMKFVGMQPPEDVADLYQAADINVIPLQGGLIYAALPSKTADCLIAHKPIITCVDEESGFADIVKKFGFINTSPENPDALKNAIIQVAEKKRKLGDFSLLHALFDRDKNVTKYCDIIEKM